MQQFFDQMLVFGRGEQDDLNKSVLVGLAAPQVGKNIRVILVDVKADGKGHVSDLRLYINPEITEKSDEVDEWYEGCYSTGQVKGIVKRPSQIVIHALDRQGNKLIEPHNGYAARIFQHEIDHLDGIRFPERMHGQKNFVHIVKEDEMALYRGKSAWLTWPVQKPLEQWQQHMRPG